MDFSKLNIEFSNMQKIICNHNIQIYKILIEKIKNENLFLQKLLDVEIDKVEESNTK